MQVQAVPSKQAQASGSAPARKRPHWRTRNDGVPRQPHVDQSDFTSPEAIEALEEARKAASPYAAHGAHDQGQPCAPSQDCPDPGEKDPVEKLDEEGKSLLAFIKESQEQLRQAAEQFEKMYPKPKPVPSGLGLATKAAMAKFSAAELSVATIVQEYSEDVPAGHVISHVPGPGARISQQTGIRLFISKGPPPDRKRRHEKEFLQRGNPGQDEEASRKISDTAAALGQLTPELSVSAVMEAISSAGEAKA